MRLFHVIFNLIILILIVYSEDLGQHQDSNNLQSKASNETSLSSMKCTESRRCGCYKGRCWAYIDDQQRPKTGWWCFTQREGIQTKEKAWAICTDSDQCSWTMTCGDCYTYVGKGNQIKTNKLIC